MKKLLVFLGVLVLVGVGVLAWYRQSVWHTLVEVRRGIESRDVAHVEKYVDLRGMSDAVVDFTAAYGTAFVGGNVLGGVEGNILGGLLGALQDGAKSVARDQIAQQIRTHIQQGSVNGKLGMFVPNRGREAIADVGDLTNGQKFAEITGKCEGVDTRLRVIFAHQDEGLLGYWRVVAADKGSIERLAKDCQRGTMGKAIPK